MADDQHGKTLHQVIEADKAGFLQHLQGLYQMYREQGDSALLKRDAAAARHTADGIKIAMRAVEAWQDAPDSGPPTQWLYGLTADEWFRLASLNTESEIAPCCGNIGELRDLLRELMTFQSPDETGWRVSLGERILQVYEADGNKPGDADAGHGLGVAAGFPLLNRVLDGIRAELAASKLQVKATFPAPLITGTRDEG
jgi:hypothetical protein